MSSRRTAPRSQPQIQRVAAMKIDTQMGSIDLATAGEDAARYERLGFDGIWTYEISRDPYFPLVPAAPWPRTA